MIPYLVPPLRGLTVLVTRPQAQADPLCSRIEAAGGTAVSFPAIAIEPLAAAPRLPAYDLVVFVSANAATHGTLQLSSTATHVAAVGKATAMALAGSGFEADVVPDSGFDSEALLMHPVLMEAPPRVLIVRGQGGRELLRDTLTQRGSVVEALEVYRRVRSTPSAAAVTQLEQIWSDPGIDVVTVTSVDLLEHLLALLPDSARLRLRDTTLLSGSRRIRDAAREMGLFGECVLSPSADDDAMLGALARWSTRARSGI